MNIMLLVKIQKNTNYEGNILEFQKDLIKEDNNKNKVEVMTTNKEEKYGETPYRCLFLVCYWLINGFCKSNSVGMFFDILTDFSVHYEKHQ